MDRCGRALCDSETHSVISEVPNPTIDTPLPVCRRCYLALFRLWGDDLRTDPRPARTARARADGEQRTLGGRR